MLDKIKTIAKINGYHEIRFKAKEELQELIEALDENIDSNIIDEMADVFIMWQQLMITYHNENKVYDMIDYKLNRQLKRMGVIE
jgi:phosphoribosyl-ATP pyrophosphohydrolase